MPQPRRTLNRESLRADLRGHAFRPGAADRVGSEIELTPLVLDAGRADPRAAIEASDRLWSGMTGGGDGPHEWRGGILTREPGGQWEFSGPPLATPGEAAAATVEAAGELRERARRGGFDLLAVGLNPWATTRAIGLHTRNPRYVLMNEYFNSIGPYGRRMMRLTGSLQVAVDHGTGAGLAERWELAQRLAPTLSAAFANSAVIGGRPSRCVGLRGLIWTRLDPARTGFPRRFLDDPAADPVDQYLDFALDAPLMFVVRDDGSFRRPEGPTTFAEWMERGLDVGYPGPEDWRVHLSTLFPEVRPHGYLEVRSLDAPGFAWLAVPILVVGHALRVASIRRDLLARLRPLHEELPSLRERAAREGLGDPTLRESARALFTAVRAVLSGDSERVVAAYDERYIQAGRTPGEELRALIPDGGRLDPLLALDLERDRLAASGRRDGPNAPSRG